MKIIIGPVFPGLKLIDNMKLESKAIETFFKEVQADLDTYQNIIFHITYCDRNYIIM